MTYNLTQIATNSTGIVGLFQGVNEVLMFGWLGSIILIGVGTILMIAFFYTTQDFGKSFAAASFICFGLSIPLSALSIVPPLAIFLTLISAAAGLAFIHKQY